MFGLMSLSSEIVTFPLQLQKVRENTEIVPMAA
jgi:hypothetical protein